MWVIAEIIDLIVPAFCMIFIIPYYQNQIYRMGNQCTKGSPQKTRLVNPYPLENRISPEKSKIKTPFELEFKMQNLCISSNCNPVYEVVFEIKDKFVTLFSHQEMSIQGEHFVWRTSHRQKITVTFDEVKNLSFEIKVFTKQREKIEKLCLNMLQLFRGPIHHDHLLPEMKSRITFDIEISQEVQLNIQCKKLFFLPPNSLDLQIQNFYYSLSLLKNLDLSKGEEAQLVPFSTIHTLNDMVLSNQLTDSSIRIGIYEQKEDEENSKEISIFGQIFISYPKFISECGCVKIDKKDGIQFHKRTLSKQEDLDLLGNKQIAIQFQVALETTEVYVEQIQCLISSQKGISAVSPQFLKGLSSTSSSIFNNSHTNLNFKELKQLLKKFRNPRHSGLQERKLLTETYDILMKDCPLSLDDEDDFEFEEMQEVLLDLLNEVGKLIVQGEDVINENVWKVFQTIFRRSELSIRCIHAIENIQSQKKIGVKLYQFLCKTLEKIVRSTAVWITYHQLKYTQKFIAYAYFRFPWLQNQFIKAIRRATDPKIDIHKLTQMGVFHQTKSPSKNMIFDWDYALFSHIKNEPEYLAAFDELQETVSMLPGWSKLLFNRDQEQFYYGFLIEILNQAEMSMTYQGKIMWEYFPYYGEIIASFLGQMDRSQCIEYSPLFRYFSVKLMLNQKLLNIFILYLFPKTCLLQRSCVMKCLDLIKSCFDVVVHKKKHLPIDFNANYFYSGIVSILQFNHSFLTLKALWILYIYYDIFTLEFQNSLDAYLMGKIFYSLFLHWCGHVRKVFMCLLENKTFSKKKVVEIHERMSNTMQESMVNQHQTQKYRRYKKYINKLIEENGEQKKKSTFNHKLPLHEQMRLKLTEKKKKHFEDNEELEEDPFKTDGSSVSAIFLQPSKQMDNRVRKWSLSSQNNSDFKIPELYQKYIPKAMKQFQEIQNSSDFDNTVEKIMELFQSKKTDF